MSYEYRMLLSPKMLARFKRFFMPRYFTGIGPMNHTRSMQLLNVKKGDSVAERFRRMMFLNHPDRGGSEYIGEKLNEARQFLEEEQKWL